MVLARAAAPVQDKQVPSTKREAKGEERSTRFSLRTVHQREPYVRVITRAECSRAPAGADSSIQNKPRQEILDKPL